MEPDLSLNNILELVLLPEGVVAFLHCRKIPEENIFFLKSGQVRICQEN
jgi:hypothetical protein